MNAKRESRSWGPCRLGGHLILLLLAAALASGCVKLISSYDAETDLAVTKLQGEIQTHLANLRQLSAGLDGKPIHPACEFSNYASKYSELSQQARLVEIRNQARAKNELTVTQLAMLRASIDTELPEVHRESDDQCLTAGALTALQATFDQHFLAILKLELAKKTYRGMN